MRTLLHICCGPCACYPVEQLRNEGMEVWGFFYNPNIHPYQEYLRRLEAVKRVEEELNFKVIYRDRYELEMFLRSVSFRESDRCRVCYHMRLVACAQVARKGKFDSFSSTLLGSTHQDHQLIRDTGRAVGKEYNIPFRYEDFRAGKAAGRKRSEGFGLYRQQYCGCIYSEKERYLGSKDLVDQLPDQAGEE